MNQSNTPRTDASETPEGYTESAFARQLETELADANKRADEWKRMAEELAKLSCCSCGHDDPTCKKCRETLAKFDQMKGKL